MKFAFFLLLAVLWLEVIRLSWPQSLPAKPKATPENVVSTPSHTLATPLISASPVSVVGEDDVAPIPAENGDELINDEKGDPVLRETESIPLLVWENPPTDTVAVGAVLGNETEKLASDDLLPAAAAFAEGKIESLTLPQKRSILFDSNSSLIPASAQELLSETAIALKEDQRLSLQLCGYADSLGSQDFNRLLSQARTMKVKQSLLLMGVSETSIAIFNSGEKPAPDTEAKARRRVDLVLLRAK